MTAPLTMNELRALDWRWVSVNQWRNDKYPGQVFTYREACEKGGQSPKSNSAAYRNSCTAAYHLLLAEKGDTVCGICRAALISELERA